MKWYCQVPYSLFSCHQTLNFDVFIEGKMYKLILNDFYQWKPAIEVQLSDKCRILCFLFNKFWNLCLLCDVFLYLCFSLQYINTNKLIRAVIFSCTEWVPPMLNRNSLAEYLVDLKIILFFSLYDEDRELVIGYAVQAFEV